MPSRGRNLKASAAKQAGEGVKMAATRKSQRNQFPGGFEKPSQDKSEEPSPELVVAEPKRKRRAFGDITNATKNTKQGGKTKKQAEKKAVKLLARKKNTQSNKDKQKTGSTEQIDSSWEIIDMSQEVKSSQEVTSSQEITSSQESLCSLSSLSSQSSQSSVSSDSSLDIEEMNLKNTQETAKKENCSNQDLRNLEMNFNAHINDMFGAFFSKKEEWEDIDAENFNDPYQMGMYAPEIFQYYKERELQFLTSAYMTKQKDLTIHMRSILVDWLVEVQENFELNHETAVSCVKLVDQYLDRIVICKEKLQLVGATAMFISCKFDERCPPMLDDFLYICDDAYTRSQLIGMEQNILKKLDFDIGMPLSYRFLRRYSKCAREALETLTLARYILESSLMEYQFVTFKESLMAASCLLLAMLMRKTGGWTKTLEHYSGYKQEELLDCVLKLNTMVCAPPNKQLTTIHTKYSHKVFHEVAKTPTLSNSVLREKLQAPSSTS